MPSDYESFYPWTEAPVTPVPEAKEPKMALDFPDVPIRSLSPAHDRVFRGRRMRAFASLFMRNGDGIGFSAVPSDWPDPRIPILGGVPTYTNWYRMVSSNPAYESVRVVVANLSLRTEGSHMRPWKEKDLRIEAIPGEYTLVNTQSPVDPSLHPALQDLAGAITWDLRQAYSAFRDPGMYYPGVTDGSIEPVTDDHVRLVIWGAGRELKRELRAGPKGGPKLPPAPLEDLPWRIQRAFAERRRLRYQQWGITHERWEENRWSVFDIEEDPDWLPAWK